MLKRLRLVENIVRGRLGREKEIAEAAAETVVVQPEEVESHDPPVCLPGQLDKVTRAPFDEPPDRDVGIARATESAHLAVLKHILPDCVVHRGGVDFRGGRLHVDRPDPRQVLSRPMRRLPEAIFCTNDASHRYFGHWLLDACATALLQAPEEALLLEVRPDWPNAAEYVRAFGLQPKPPGLYRVGRLALPQDFSQGSSKRARYAELRRRLSESFPEAGHEGRAIYLRRGRSGVARVVANEDELVSALSAKGFESFDITGASLPDIVHRFRNADVVVSMEGSHLNHLYLTLPAGAKLVTLVPADRFTMVQTGYANAVGLRFGFVVADPTPDGYDVSLPDLHATLELMGA